MNTLDRYRGALLGLATGDALGTTLEFRRPGTFTPVTDMTGGGPFRLEPGQWTDDTSMALCLATSLVERRAFDPLDQLDRYLRWYESGYLSSTGRCFDIGLTTRQALDRYRSSKDAGSPRADCGLTEPTAAGNGSIMRLAPVPMAFANDVAAAIERSGDSSRTTHATTEAVDACRYFGALIAGALRGASKDELLPEMYAPVRGYWDAHALAPRIETVARGSFRERQPPAIAGSGYVVKSLEAALWAFHTTSDFTTGCLAAVNLGDDADTTGAVYGQIAGAYYGADAIPTDWLKKLTMRQEIDTLATQLHDMAQ